jgi:large subunit ribosomal protein L18
LCVFRSLKHIYAQVLDDDAGHTIASASTLEGGIRSEAETKTKVEAARLVGAAVAERAMERGVTAVVFDRGGYKFHGRVKALADSARETGLEF